MNYLKRIIKKVLRIVRRLYPKFMIGFEVNRFIKKSFDMPDYNGIPFQKDFEDNCMTFLGNVDAHERERLKRDMVECYLLYGITPDEYFLHDFPHYPDSYRKTILSRKRKDKVAIQKMGKNWHSYFDQLKDKWEFYKLAQPYFKRDVCRVELEEDYESMKDFVQKHPVFIAKPRKASCGIGVHVVDIKDYAKDFRKIFDHYRNLENGQWMFEEKIIQDERMAQWHPSSVNTIRIPSIMTRKGPVVILPLFRTGKNGNVVDNCHNDGGLMSVPDPETGILVTDGYDVFTNVVERHPNSGLAFKGWQVPEWESLLETASELHQSLPRAHKYVGFDFALTSKGWVVVEGNWGNFPHQLCVHHGIRAEYEKLMDN